MAEIISAALLKEFEKRDPLRYTALREMIAAGEIVIEPEPKAGAVR